MNILCLRFFLRHIVARRAAPRLYFSKPHDPKALIFDGFSGRLQHFIWQRSRGTDTSPATYDSFAARRLPAVRNQAPYGSCWAFGSIGAMEADLITDGADTDIDLSELHLAYYGYHGYYDEKRCSIGDEFDYTENDWLDQGGDPNVAARVLSNLVGAASEASVPYAWGKDYAPGPFARSQS